MYCWNCRAQLPDGSDFCTQCGARVTPQQPIPQQPLPPYGQPAGPVTVDPGKKKRKTRLILLISAGVLVVACAVLIPILIQSAKEADYKAAIALVDSGELSKAREEFVSLGGYKDSKDMAETCQNMMDYDEANGLMSSGDYAGAKEIYVKLGDYEDSESLAAECQNTIDYNAAVVLMDAGNNEAARDAFLKLGEYSDAAGKATECQNRIDYASATGLMNSGDLQGAVAAFAALGDYQDSAQLSVDCQNQIDYAAASDAFNQGKFYTAYKMFGNLGAYSDSAARAESCIQAIPENGEIYRNSDYGTKKCPLTIKTPDDGYYSFLQFYDSETNALVSTLFISPGSKAKVKLPKGSYFINTAYGTTWFGPDERFGDEGIYQEKMSFDDGGETVSVFKLKGGYSYTLTLG